MARWPAGARLSARRTGRRPSSRSACLPRTPTSWRIPACPTSTSGVGPNGPGPCACDSTSRSTRNGSAPSGRAWRGSRPRAAPCWWPTTPGPSPPTRRSSCTASRRSSAAPSTGWPTTSSGRSPWWGRCGRGPAGSRPAPPTPTASCRTSSSWPWSSPRGPRARRSPSPTATSSVASGGVASSRSPCGPACR